MKENRLIIEINQSLHNVFLFCITPPNSTKWIPGIVGEETSELPVKNRTVYKLTNEQGSVSNVTVVNIINDDMIEWISEDDNYHCKYTFKSLGQNITELQYDEWVDKGDIEEPFNMNILGKLKKVLEI